MIQLTPLQHVITTVGFALFTAFGTELAICMAQQTGTDVEQTDFLKTGFATELGIERYFGPMTEDQLLTAKFSKEQAISLNSAWLLCKARHHQLIAKKFLGKKVVKTESILLKREYLGFMSGKLNLEIPAWWSDALIDCPVDNRLPRKNNLTLSYGFTETLGVAHRKDVKVTRVIDNELTGSVNGKEFHVKIDSDQDNYWYPGCIRTFDVNVKDDGSIFVVVTHESDFWAKVNRYGNMGDLVWTYESQDRAVGNVEISPVTVELILSEGNLYLFGACATDIFCEVLSMEDGRLLNRFSTLRTNDLPMLDGLAEIEEDW